MKVIFTDCQTTTIARRLQARGVEIPDWYMDFLDEVRNEYKEAFLPYDNVISLNTEGELGYSCDLIMGAIDKRFKRTRPVRKRNYPLMSNDKLIP